ncbi:hypothetical protein AGLY_006606 [Aphis glycines]|uniref:Uncharacterized protein n=1 Tax=Aphis glycines TaxID=307491 RepID=A0A6G0TRQ7_APHGL|nr:hypothetical protein AGLY_006606 [Aphis glycines]
MDLLFSNFTKLRSTGLLILNTFWYYFYYYLYLILLFHILLLYLNRFFEHHQLEQLKQDVLFSLIILRNIFCTVSLHVLRISLSSMVRSDNGSVVYKCALKYPGKKQYNISLKNKTLSGLHSLQLANIMNRPYFFIRRISLCFHAKHSIDGVVDRYGDHTVAAALRRDITHRWLSMYASITQVRTLNHSIITHSLMS